MEREQFDKLMKWAKDSCEDELEKMLKQMFPQFSTPKFRRCKLYPEEDDSGNWIDTTSFHILEDDEGFYIIPLASDFIYQFHKIHGCKYTLRKDSEEAQQILEYLKGEE